MVRLGNSGVVGRFDGLSATPAEKANGELHRKEKIAAAAGFIKVEVLFYLAENLSKAKCFDKGGNCGIEKVHKESFGKISQRQKTAGVKGELVSLH